MEEELSFQLKINEESKDGVCLAIYILKIVAEYKLETDPDKFGKCLNKAVLKGLDALRDKCEKESLSTKDVIAQLYEFDTTYPDVWDEVWH